MGNNEWDDELEREITQEIERCWHEVFKASKKIVEDAKLLGFRYMEEASPNIHQILDSLKLIENDMNLVWSKIIVGEIKIEDTRLIHNIFQQILKMKQMATALKTKDRTLYDESLTCISNQSSM